MNRAERRRMERERRAPSSTAYNPAERPPRRDGLEPDAPGRHVWIVATVHRVSDDGARRAYVDGEQVLLDQESLVDMHLGCWVCEGTYEEVHRLPCRGPAGT